MSSTRPSRNGCRSRAWMWQRTGTSWRTCIWPPIEPEAVTYAEVDADGVPALWCIPQGSDPDRVLLHSHSGGSVVTSMHTDRKAIGHIAKAVGVRALVLNFRRAPEHKFPAQIDDVEKAYRWLLAQKIRPENIASIGHSIGGNLAVSLAVTLRDKGAPLPAAILSVSPWYDMEMKNETWESNAETDVLLTRQAVEGFREAWIGGTGVARNDPAGQYALRRSDRPATDHGLLRRT